MKTGKSAVVFLFVLNVSWCRGIINSTTNQFDIVNSDRITGIDRYAWLRGAQNIIASPTGHIMIQVAKELLNRSTGNSQILSLNLTNLLIIVLLKVLIFAAGLIGAGHWSETNGQSPDYARSNKDKAFGVNDEEANLIIGFLAAQSGYDDCLYNAACTAPQQAIQYITAGKGLLNAVDGFLDKETLDGDRYSDLIELVEQAAYNGSQGKACNSTNSKCKNLLLFNDASDQLME